MFLFDKTGRPQILVRYTSFEKKKKNIRVDTFH